MFEKHFWKHFLGVHTFQTVPKHVFAQIELFNYFRRKLHLTAWQGSEYACHFELIIEKD